MKSKVHPKYKTTYRVGNWREYERALVQRGDVTLWLSAAATDAWRPSPSGRPGGQKRFSDVAIETALILRLVFGLPLRQTEGFVRSVLALMGTDLDAPDHTTLSRRSQQLAVMLRRIPATTPSISSSIAPACRSWAKARGPPRNTGDTASVGGRSSISVLTSRV